MTFLKQAFGLHWPAKFSAELEMQFNVVKFVRHWEISEEYADIVKQTKMIFSLILRHIYE